MRLLGSRYMYHWAKILKICVFHQSGCHWVPNTGGSVHCWSRNGSIGTYVYVHKCRSCRYKYSSLATQFTIGGHVYVLSVWLSVTKQTRYLSIPTSVLHRCSYFCNRCTMMMMMMMMMMIPGMNLYRNFACLAAGRWEKTAGINFAAKKSVSH